MCLTSKTKIQGKLNVRGTVCVFVGYPQSHGNDAHRVLNRKTNHIVKSRDVIWLNRSCGDWIKSQDNHEKVEDDLSNSEFEKDATRNKMNRQPKKIK
jgi:hypothetical protein